MKFQGDISKILAQRNNTEDTLNRKQKDLHYLFDGIQSIHRTIDSNKQNEDNLLDDVANDVVNEMNIMQYLENIEARANYLKNLKEYIEAKFVEDGSKTESITKQDDNTEKNRKNQLKSKTAHLKSMDQTPTVPK